MAAMFSDSLPQAKSPQALEPKTEERPEEYSSRPTSRSEDMKDLPGSKHQTRPKTQDSQRSSSKSVDKPPGMKRDTSDIFKSFAKSKPKMKRQDTDSSNVDSPPNSVSWMLDSYYLRDLTRYRRNLAQWKMV
jgi:DNA polymerase delta subunit 3